MAGTAVLPDFLKEGPALIACGALVGVSRKPRPWLPPDVVDLQRELARLDLSAASVRHRQCLENFRYGGNDVLKREVKGQASLIPAICLTPDGAPAAHSLEQTMAAAFSAGMRVAWMNPEGAHAFRTTVV